MPKDEGAAPADEVQEISTDNDPNGESVTEEEVSELLNLPVADDETKEEAEDESSDESSDGEDDDANDEDDSEEAYDEDEGDGDSEEENDEEEDDDGSEAEGESSEGTPSTSTDDQFTLEVEDVNGDKVTIRPGDDLEKVLADFEPKNNGQIFKVLQDVQKLEQRKADYDKSQEEASAKKAEAKSIADIQSGWQKEIKNLAGNKRIPVDSKGNADQKRIDAVMDFMSKENDKRQKDNRPFLTSFEDALDKLELKELRDAEAEKEKKDKEIAKKKGGMVGGSSAPASGDSPVYKPGARSAEEAARAMNLY